MACPLREGRCESRETDQEDNTIIQMRDDDVLTRLVAVKVVSSDPIFIYFKSSVSSELGMGKERKRGVKDDSKVFA